MANVDDVAAAVLNRTGTIDTFKLQKLVYYCQAWHLVWEGQPLFASRIEAWANGPVVRKLYRQHRGVYQVGRWPLGSSSNLYARETSTIKAVVDYYNKFTGWQLAQLTHRETPWIEARNGLEPTERGEAEISLASMLEYYGSLTPVE
jgi:uncharacterized phage-associated protein